MALSSEDMDEDLMSNEMESRLEQVRLGMSDVDARFRQFVKARPFTAVLAAVLTGYMMGRLMGRR